MFRDSSIWPANDDAVDSPFKPSPGTQLVTETHSYTSLRTPGEKSESIRGLKETKYIASITEHSIFKEDIFYFGINTGALYRNLPYSSFAVLNISNLFRWKLFEINKYKHACPCKHAYIITGLLG
jgi:hypothetical protein